jgi:methionyl-tRNA formyltransferase
LVSGKLGLICLSKIFESRPVNFVLTDKNSQEIISFCRKNNLPFFAGNPRNGNGHSFIRGYQTDVLLSINYLFIVGKDILDHPSKFAINFHGSLLPKYRGRTPHVWAIINNEQFTGVTAHLMSENCDEGDIILQEKIELTQDLTGADVLNIFFSIYPSLIDELLRLIDMDKISLSAQEKEKATYFGQRIPEDGEINWHWQKERIRNLVRAQAYPYPGAFTFYKDHKIIINKVEYSDLGFAYTDSDGLILECDPSLIVKTPNGAIKITEMIVEGNIIFKKGDCFHA